MSRCAKPGEVGATHNGVKIVGHLNVPGRLAATASALYARNLYAFVETLIDKDDEDARGELGRRTGARHQPHPRRRDRPPAFQPKA